MTDGAKRGRGRPRKDPEKGKRQNYTFRLHDSTRERLIEAAKVQNRTLSEEIEYRVERSFSDDEELGTLRALDAFDYQALKYAENSLETVVKYASELAEHISELKRTQHLTEEFLEAKIKLAVMQAFKLAGLVRAEGSAE